MISNINRIEATRRLTDGQTGHELSRFIPLYFFIAQTQSMELRRARWLEKLANMPATRNPRKTLITWTPQPRPAGRPIQTTKKAYAHTLEKELNLSSDLHSLHQPSSAAAPTAKDAVAILSLLSTLSTRSSLKSFERCHGTFFVFLPNPPLHP